MSCCEKNCNQGRDCPNRDDDYRFNQDAVVDCAVAIVFATVAICMSMLVLSHLL